MSTPNKNLDSLILPKELRPSLIPVHCMNPGCRTRFSETLYVDSLNAPCPACHEKQFLYPCDAVHLLVPCSYGPIESRRLNKRFHFACDLARKAWNYGLNNPAFPIHYTPDRASVNCPDCLKLIGHSLQPNQQFNNGLDQSLLDSLAVRGG